MTTLQKRCIIYDLLMQKPNDKNKNKIIYFLNTNDYISNAEYDKITAYLEGWLMTYYCTTNDFLCPYYKDGECTIGNPAEECGDYIEEEE